MNEKQEPQEPREPEAPGMANSSPLKTPEPETAGTAVTPGLESAAYRSETSEAADVAEVTIPEWPQPEAAQPDAERQPEAGCAPRRARGRRWRVPGLRLRGARTPGLAALVAVALISAMLGGLITGTLLVNAPSMAALLPHWRGGAPSAGLTNTSPGATLVNTSYPSLLEGSAGTVVSVSQKVGPSVVKVTSYGMGRSWYSGRVAREVELGSGSGFIIEASGYIVTNQHVINNATRVEVTLADQKAIPADIVGQDQIMDIAVLKVNRAGLPPVTLGDSDKLQVGELAIVIGNPLGLDHTVTAGVISALNRSIEDLGELNYKVIQTDASINPGNSGGPLVNGACQVVGITSAKVQATGVEGLGFAIPINTAKSIINELMQKGKIVRPWLGVSVAEADSAVQYGVQLDHGLLIVQAVPGGPAIKAGVKDNDILLQVDGHNVDTFAKLQAILAQHRPGDKIRVTVKRGDTQLTITVALEAKSST